MHFKGNKASVTQDEGFWGLMCSVVTGVSTVSLKFAERVILSVLTTKKEEGKGGGGGRREGAVTW